MPSLEEASHWNRSLRWFRFSFAHGGPANDMDTLSARIPFDGTESGLLMLADQLGVREALEPGVVKTDVRTLSAFPALSAPELVHILNAPAFLLITREAIDVIAAGAHGKNWEVTSDDFANALRFEEELPSRGIRFEPRAPFELIEGVFNEALALGLGEARERTSDPGKHKEWAGLRARLVQSFPLFQDDRVWSDALAQIETLEGWARRPDVTQNWLSVRNPGMDATMIEKAWTKARSKRSGS